MAFEGMHHNRNLVHEVAKQHGFWEPVLTKVTDGQGIEHQMMAERSFGDLMALVHTEASEAYEEWRHGHGYNETYYTYKAQPGVARTAMLKDGKTWCNVGPRHWYDPDLEDPEQDPNWVELEPATAARLGYDCKPEGIPIELADIILRVLDIAGGFGIDIEEALRLKHAHNAHRPYLHGGKRS